MSACLLHLDLELRARWIDAHVRDVTSLARVDGRFNFGFTIGLSASRSCTATFSSYPARPRVSLSRRMHFSCAYPSAAVYPKKLQCSSECCDCSATPSANCTLPARVQFHAGSFSRGVGIIPSMLARVNYSSSCCPHNGFVNLFHRLDALDSTSSRMTAACCLRVSFLFRSND